MSSSFFLSNSSGANKIKTTGSKRKYEGAKPGKPKIKKKFIVGGKNRPKDKDSNFSRGKNNEEILSDGSDVEGKNTDENRDYIGSDGVHSDESEDETTEEKRLRLAKKYLEEIERQEKERIGEISEHKNEQTGSFDGEIESAVNKRLRLDDLEEAGKLTRAVAHNYENLEVDQLVVIPKIQLLRDHKAHKSSITCLAVSWDGKYVLSGSKDGGLVLWGMGLQKENSSNTNDAEETNSDLGSQSSEKETLYTDSMSVEKLARIVGGRKGCEDKHLGHCSSVNCVAISSDSKFLASGDDSNLIIIWKISQDITKAAAQKNLSSGLDKVHVFRGHRSPVSGLAFRTGTHTLYSCSHDRSVKSWNLDEMAYVETLFGHQDRITGVDAGLRERVLTSGGRDGTARIWKIVEESQLVFNAPAVLSETPKDSNKKGPGTIGSGSVDSIKLLDEQHFVTCGEDGHVSLWNVMKKKPVSTIPRAHGSDPTNNDPRWISSITTMHNTDLIASGSNDGIVRLWKCTEKYRSIVEIASLPITNLMGTLQSNEDCTSTSSWSSGFVNGVCIHPSGRALIIGIGQEHRLGRWWRHKEARNGILVLPLNPHTENETPKLE